MQVIQQAAPTERVGRYPKHAFVAREMPFQLQPIMIAPVLPGETMKNLFFESRVVSDPVKNPLIGWKKEFYFYYVPVTLLMVDAIRDMFIDPANTDIASTLGIPASNGPYYTAKGGVDYLKRATLAVARAHFWDEDDADQIGDNGIPNVQIRDRFWLDSLTDKDLSILSADPADTIDTPTNFEQLATLQEAYDQLRQVGVANITFEDFLRSYGVSIPETVDEKKPELLARFSDFQYPSNTIDPVTGSPSSAISWVFKNGKRDPKLFKEPGFIVGFSITRPKVYFGGLAGNLSAHLTRAWDWLPNYLNEASPSPMPETAFKKFAADTGPLGDRNQSDAYWVEMRDLFLFGDQFQNVNPWVDDTTNPLDGANHLLGSPGLGFGDSPVAHGKYLHPDDLQALFKNPVNKYIRQDGYVSLQVQGKVREHFHGQLTAANLFGE